MQGYQQQQPAPGQHQLFPWEAQPAPAAYNPLQPAQLSGLQQQVPQQAVAQPQSNVFLPPYLRQSAQPQPQQQQAEPAGTPGEQRDLQDFSSSTVFVKG